ncbi:fungal transcriptional regulatory protein, N-terminal [Lipomyces tetrasporus]|uniref:Fungal transcriptional regulatory protein, N-terminal n=1 Tax=Lipomyces tetrasporus TaxID=54092 RepID=A0AAD7QK78_9ASCO|nr:fungal transcriptional regulatory protein, N-terminal [Lipomyces tetrasporus]KAJ8096588.1 fungal transcriptional regulatory protein, N-terminal [Lipomyces tetrasporus]
MDGREELPAAVLLQVAHDMAVARQPISFDPVLPVASPAPSHNDRSNTVTDIAASLDKAVRACTNCVRAKARCSPSVHTDGKCERCHRMKKECKPSPPVRKRRAATKSSGHNKVEKLEEKLDGLVALLKSATQGAPGSLNASSINSALEELMPSAPDNEANPNRSRDVDRSRAAGREPTEDPFTPTTSSSSRTGTINQQPFVIHPYLEPSAEEAELYVDRFHNQFLANLPFFTVSSLMTAQQLRLESPLLWLSIMTVGSTRSIQQIGLSNEVRSIFGREAYVKGTRNMDFLLAVLVYTAWDRHYCLDKPISTSLIQLSIAILYDMGLDKLPPQDPGLALAYELKGASRPSQLTLAPAMEERRALLGCFLISTVPPSWRKGETLRWTPYFDECVRVLEEQKELETDILLAQLVKLRLIAENAMGYPDLSTASTKPQATAYLKLLQTQMRNFKSNIPPELGGNTAVVEISLLIIYYDHAEVLLLELHNTEFMVYSIALSPVADTFPGQSSQRFECMYACLQAVKSWVDTFFMLQPIEYVGLSSLMYANMMRCFVGFYRLSTYDHPEWDRALLHESVNVSWVLEEASERFGRVKEMAGLDPDTSQAQDSFSIMASKLRSMKTSWDAMVTSTAPLFSPLSLDELESFSNEFLTSWNW